jgi:PPOX class probable F420-dependent enzyme
LSLTAKKTRKENPRMLLPLADEPFTAPTDRDMVPSERRQFVRTHRTCVFGYRRHQDGPAMSIVYYIPTDDDELLISTMADRSKARVVRRDGKVSLCILDERWPFTFLQVYADAVVERDRELVVDVMMSVAGRMSGNQPGDDARPFIAEMAEQENRVVIRCRPYATLATPPRHLHANDQAEQITHWTSSNIPWNAPDPVWGEHCSAT